MKKILLIIVPILIALSGGIFFYVQDDDIEKNNPKINISEKNECEGETTLLLEHIEKEKVDLFLQDTRYNDFITSETDNGFEVTVYDIGDYKVEYRDQEDAFKTFSFTNSQIKTFPQGKIASEGEYAIENIEGYAFEKITLDGATLLKTVGDTVTKKGTYILTYKNVCGTFDREIEVVKEDETIEIIYEEQTIEDLTFDEEKGIFVTEHTLEFVNTEFNVLVNGVIAENGQVSLVDEGEYSIMLYDDSGYVEYTVRIEYTLPTFEEVQNGSFFEKGENIGRLDDSNIYINDKPIVGEVTLNEKGLQKITYEQGDFSESFYIYVTDTVVYEDQNDFKQQISLDDGIYKDNFYEKDYFVGRSDVSLLENNQAIDYLAIYMLEENLSEVVISIEKEETLITFEYLKDDYKFVKEHKVTKEDGSVEKTIDGLIFQGNNITLADSSVHRLTSLLYNEFEIENYTFESVEQEENFNQELEKRMNALIEELENDFEIMNYIFQYKFGTYMKEVMYE